LYPEAEKRGSLDKDQPVLHSGLKASLNYIKKCIRIRIAEKKVYEDEKYLEPHF
jgi:hypothetical protein